MFNCFLVAVQPVVPFLAQFFQVGFERPDDVNVHPAYRNGRRGFFGEDGLAVEFGIDLNAQLFRADPAGEQQSLADGGDQIASGFAQVKQTFANHLGVGAEDGQVCHQLLLDEAFIILSLIFEGIVPDNPWAGWTGRLGDRKGRVVVGYLVIIASPGNQVVH